MDNISDIINECFYVPDTGKIYNNIINNIDRIVIIKALERSRGNQIKAAKILGLHRNTLSAKIKKLNIDIWRFKK